MSRVAMLRRRQLPQDPTPKMTTEERPGGFVVSVEGGPYCLLMRDTEAQAKYDGAAYLSKNYRYDALVGKWVSR
jgi:hypothetical protein